MPLPLSPFSLSFPRRRHSHSSPRRRRSRSPQRTPPCSPPPRRRRSGDVSDGRAHIGRISPAFPAAMVAPSQAGCGQAQGPCEPSAGVEAFPTAARPSGAAHKAEIRQHTDLKELAILRVKQIGHLFLPPLLFFVVRLLHCLMFPFLYLQQDERTEAEEKCWIVGINDMHVPSIARVQWTVD